MSTPTQRTTRANQRRLSTVTASCTPLLRVHDSRGLRPARRPQFIGLVDTISIDTPHGEASAHVQRAENPRGALVLGHGAGGGVASRDLVAASEVALSEGLSVAL